MGPYSYKQDTLESTRKIYECYRFLAANSGNNKTLQKKIDELAHEHLTQH